VACDTFLYLVLYNEASSSADTRPSVGCFEFIGVVSACIQDWTVYIDQSKASLDRGGSATLDAFVGLAPNTVQVLPANLPKLSKAKGP
jgi:hypothetical protein